MNLPPSRPLLAVIGYCFLSSASFGEQKMLTQQGNSIAKIEKLSEGGLLSSIENTTFVFDDGPIETSGPVNNSKFPATRNLLFRISQKTTRSSGDEKGKSSIDIETSSVTPQSVMWRLSDESDSYDIHSEYFLISTVSYGCCGSDNSYRAFSELTGKFLFSYSYEIKNNTPITLRSDAFNPQGFRFLAYQDNYWPTRDKVNFLDPDGKLTLAGILTYASTLQPIQKLAIFYDAKTYGDPSSDPDRIEVTYGTKKWNFKESDSSSDYEVSYWNRDAIGSSGIYSGLTVNLYWGDEMVSVPIKDDTFDSSNVMVGKKIFTKVVPLPAKYWTIEN